MNPLDWGEASVCPPWVEADSADLRRVRGRAEAGMVPLRDMKRRLKCSRCSSKGFADDRAIAAAA